MVVSFNDYSDGARRRKIKHSLKKLSKFGATVINSNDHIIDELYAIREVNAVILQPETSGESLPSIIDGASIPTDRREEFIVAVGELANKHHIDLPLSINWLNGVVRIRPTFQLHHVTDKQKLFKLISDYIELVVAHGGNISTISAEGRLKASAAYSQIDKEIIDVYSQIRMAFDPFGTLNPGVKQENDLKTLISQLDPDYNMADFAKYSPID
jgi:FAD/FMN-containing dehydrogenase